MNEEVRGEDGAQDKARGVQHADTAAQAELEQLAARMAAALASLDCPPNCGAIHEFIEFGAQLHNEELEWACLVHVVRRRR